MTSTMNFEPVVLTQAMCKHPEEYREEEIVAEDFYAGKLEYCTRCGKEINTLELKEVEPY